MAAGNQSWCPNINNFMRPPILSSHQQQPFISPSSNNSFYNENHNNNNVFQSTMNMLASPTSSWLDDYPTYNQEHQQQQQHLESWIQLLGGVLMGGKKMDTNNNWEEEIMLQQQEVPQHYPHQLIDVKQESSVNSNNNSNSIVYNTTKDQEYQVATTKWNHHVQQFNNNILVSSPQSCVTSFSSNNNLLDFSSSISSDNNLHSRNNPPLAHDLSSECNSRATGGAAKKAKVQSSSCESTTLKVRKEKLGDRITALHQLVSPFGKTDTASVLLEAIGYIRFLQSQIEALSLPYLNNGTGNKKQPQPMQGKRKWIFPEDPGQLSNDNCLKRKGGPDQDSSYEEAKDLRSRGLCLVPISCTMHVGSENGADYWAPAYGGGF